MAKYEIWIPAIQSRGVCLAGNDGKTDLEIVTYYAKQFLGYPDLWRYVIHIRRNHKRVARYRVIRSIKISEDISIPEYIARNAENRKA